jgi:hypothetical protein
MAKLKTQETGRSVTRFLEGVSDKQQREDSFALVELLRQVTKAEPKMWGSSIVGFGSYHYVYDSGHEGDSCLVGFSPRKPSISVYIMGGSERHAELLKKLGKFKMAKGCLYIKRLEDVHLPTLKALVRESVRHLKKKYGTGRAR